MKVVFRADASVNVGTGHVMRCLSLADELRIRKAEVRFLCARAPGDLIEYISSRRGYPVAAVGVAAEPGHGPHAADWERDAEASAAAIGGAPPDWLIVDHYGLDARWQNAVKPKAGALLAIDDLADRPHAADMLLDQNLYESPEARYRDKVPAGCRQLLGPSYALLRPEFRAAREGLRGRSGALRRILIFFGGSDPGDETSKALAAYKGLALPGGAADVVVGASNPHRGAVEAACRDVPGARFHCQVENIAELMAAADLAVGAGGTATWERCCVGLPSVVAVLADNQDELARCAHARGVVENLGRAQALGPADYARAILAMTPARLLDMEAKCRGIVDGNGCRRVAESIMAK